MKRRIILALLVPAVLLLTSCKKAPDAPVNRTIQVELGASLPAVNAAGDAPYDYSKITYTGYATNAGDRLATIFASKNPGSVSGNLNVKQAATQLWCYSYGDKGEVQTLSVPSQLSRTASFQESDLSGMVFCTETISLEGDNPYVGNIQVLSGAVVLDIMDSQGRWTGKPFSSVTIAAENGKALAGDVTLCLKEARVGELNNASSSISFACEGLKVGTPAAPTGLGAVVLPCKFTGTVTLQSEYFNATLSIDQPLYLQAGYVKHIQVDLALADVEALIVKHFPYRLAVIGDSISTFEGIIPSSHRAYYTNPPASGCDVDSWTKTYWGHLINDYWHCELDVNTSWSGSSVASGKAGSVRTPFVDDSRLSLLQNPDCVILFGGTNDALASNEIGLGEFSYDTPLASINHYRRFRDAYIYVIKYIQQKFPEAVIICIIGTDVTGDYGTSVEAIAKHYDLPIVDFRGEKNVAGKVTIYSGSHPDAAGHAYKAQKIYEQTLDLFQ